MSRDEAKKMMDFIGNLEGVAQKMTDGPLHIETYVRHGDVLTER